MKTAPTRTRMSEALMVCEFSGLDPSRGSTTALLIHANGGAPDCGADRRTERSATAPYYRLTGVDLPSSGTDRGLDHQSSRQRT